MAIYKAVKDSVMLVKKCLMIFFLALCLSVNAAAENGKVSLIHIGDLHGHLLPRPDMREGAESGDYQVGGLAYVYDQIKKIRVNYPESLLINTGDSIQGSAEALYTQGEAMVKVLNHFKDRDYLILDFKEFSIESWTKKKLNTI